MERGRGPENQASINSMWSLQPHCGKFDCGPQIKQNGFNLWCHPGPQLLLVVYLCVSAKQSFSPFVRSFDPCMQSHNFVNIKKHL